MGGRPEPRPCPFCHGKDVEVLVDDVGMFVRCDACGGIGPRIGYMAKGVTPEALMGLVDAARDEAVRRWNGEEAGSV